MTCPLTLFVNRKSTDLDLRYTRNIHTTETYLLETYFLAVGWDEPFFSTRAGNLITHHGLPAQQHWKMADSTSGAPPSSSQRRKSFVEMLNPRVFGNASSVTAAPSSAIPVPSSPGVASNRKSMSMALGLSGSANSQDSPFNAFARQRRASISTSTASGSPEFRNVFEDSAVIEEDDRPGTLNSPPSPTFARRLSFGAQALREAKQGGLSPNFNAGRRPSSSLFTLNEDSGNGLANTVTRSQGTAKTGGKSQGRSY